MMRAMIRWLFILAALTGLLAALTGLMALLGVFAVSASAPRAEVPAMVNAPLAQQSTPIPPADNSACLSCHQSNTLEVTLPNSDTLPLYVDPDSFSRSVHGQQGMACVACHTNISGYPHPKLTAPDRRQVSLDLYTTCRTCHADNYAKTLDSVHQRALAAGQRFAAICTDCHGAHDVRSPETQPRFSLAATCSKCHSIIYNEYKDSVHGSALLKENPDVPVCIDCHGVHNIPDPTTAAFRLKSPTEMCGKCHTDSARMAKYGISTQVLNTYVADFHGTTVTLFEKQSPDQPTNKPVCFDCHGVHNIQSVNDPKEGLQVKENMLKVCQKCHPDATANFPSAWLSHYIPSPTKTPLVFTVNLFYQLLIPSVLGGMAALVALDAGRRLVNRLRPAGVHQHRPHEEAEQKPLISPISDKAATSDEAQPIGGTK